MIDVINIWIYDQSNYMKDDSQMIQKCCFIHGFYKKMKLNQVLKKK